MLHLCAGASPLTCRRATRPVLVQAETAPDSEVEFEQLLLSAPNSSFVWVKYLAFLVSLGEMDRARQLAERALAKIHYRCGPAAAGCAARWCLLLAAPSRGCMVMLKAEPPAAQLLSCGRWAPLAALTRHVCVAHSDPQLCASCNCACSLQRGAGEVQHLGGLAEHGELVRQRGGGWVPPV